MKRILFLLFLFSLTGCDNHLFTQFFRNPYIVEIAKLETLKKDQLYEFNVSLKALNRTQTILIEFQGSEPDKLNFFTRGGDENFKGGETVFYSSQFPDKEIKFEVIAIDSNNLQYTFKSTGRSSGMEFHNEGEPLIGNKIVKIEIKANLTHKNVQMTWISRTGK